MSIEVQQASVKNKKPLISEWSVIAGAGLELAGYIRATAAETIREAKPEKLSYNGRLMRLSDSEIIVQLTI